MLGKTIRAAARLKERLSDNAEQFRRLEVGAMDSDRMLAM